MFHGVDDHVLYDLGDFVDDYGVDDALRNDLGLLWLVDVDRDGPVRLEAVPLHLDFCHTALATGDDARWIRHASAPRARSSALPSPPTTVALSSSGADRHGLRRKTRPAPVRDIRPSRSERTDTRSPWSAIHPAAASRVRVLACHPMTQQGGPMGRTVGHRARRRMFVGVLALAAPALVAGLPGACEERRPPRLRQT